MKPPTSVDRDEIIGMLAFQQGRAAELVPERIGSLDVAWILHTIQERYDITLDVCDADLARMGTVTGAVEVLTKALSRVAAR